MCFMRVTGLLHNQTTRIVLLDRSHIICHLMLILVCSCFVSPSLPSVAILRIHSAMLARAGQVEEGGKKTRDAALGGREIAKPDLTPIFEKLGNLPKGTNGSCPQAP